MDRQGDMKIKKAVLITIAVLAILTVFLVALAVRQHKGEERQRLEKYQKEVSVEKAEKNTNAKGEKTSEETKKSEAKKSLEDKKTTEDKKVTEENTANNNGQAVAIPSGNGVTGGHIVCIDPGHQAKGDSKMEPNGPGSSTMKARVTGGTRGTTTGIYEYQLNLIVADELRDELTRRGYTVYMTRESHNVNISNKERAEYATSVGAEITVRIHANGADSSKVNGAMTLVPSKNNRYVSRLASASYNLGKSILDSYCVSAGFKNLGVQNNDTMTGINFCTSPVAILEMGFMSNPSDDTNMNNEQCQSKMVNGIANGIDAYFGK